MTAAAFAVGACVGAAVGVFASALCRAAAVAAAPARWCSWHGQRCGHVRGGCPDAPHDHDGTVQAARRALGLDQDDRA